MKKEIEMYEMIYLLNPSFTQQEITTKINYYQDFLTQQCRNKFTIASMGRGKFGRILGIVYSETGIDICKLMIKTGHAVEYYGGKKTKVWA